MDVRTEYPTFSRRDGSVDVDYTVAVPAGVALDVYSVSGRIRVDGVKGSIRFGSVSGSISSVNTPKVEYVRTVSGNVDLGDISHDGNLTLSSVSANIDLSGVKARSLDVNTVSGDVRLHNAAVERLTARGLSGAFEYGGTLVRNGRYEVNSHAGSVRFTLAGDTGFELNAGSFSGSIRSDYRMTVGGDSRDLRPQRGPGARRDGLQSTFGDGSARLDLHTFSGNIVIAKR